MTTRIFTLFGAVIIALTLASPLTAQQFCGFDRIMEAMYHRDQDTDALYELNHRILARQMSLSTGERVSEHVIPIVVHVIHQNGPENISDAQIELAIDQMNRAFENDGGAYFNPEGVAIPIQFCLAKKDPDGEFTTGILRVEDPLTNMLVPSQDLELKNLSRWDTEKYLNIWVVGGITREPSNPGVLGYATFPIAHGTDADGIVCEATYFGIGDETNSKVHVHEVGHYLGLYHTFQDGCFNDDCQTNGDWVCDTPPDQHTFNVLCYDGTNSCLTDEDDTSENNPFRPIALGGLGDQLDQQDNYMDYSNLYCFNRFTPGQSERMLAALLEVRSSLLEGDRCTPPCDDPFDVSVTGGSTEIEVGESTPFVVNGSGFAGVNWILDGVEVGNGNSYVFNPSAAGTYHLLVEIFGNDPGCTQFYNYELTVFCGAVATIGGETGTWPPGSTLVFESIGEGAENFLWSINGEEAGNNASLEFTFNDEGLYVISLQVSNGFCSTSATQTISIGNCPSGREAYVWYFHNVTGEIFGLDFNSGTPLLITENPNIPAPVNHNKSTFCDATGELLYFTNGDALYRADGSLVQNGDGLQTHESAHWGSVFIRKPGSDHEIYLFTAGSEVTSFADGVRYSIIDETLDNGLGGIVDGSKNTFVSSLINESVTTVRHCNLVDFWLTMIEPATSEFRAYLVTEDGISSEPVVSSVNVTDENISWCIKANGAGDRLVYGGHVFDFDPATGEAQQVHTFDLEFVVAYAFSESGNKLYFQSGNLNINMFQADVTGSVESWDDNLSVISNQAFSAFGFGMSLGPDGRVYHEQSVSGWLSIIENPDAPAEDVIFNENAHFIGGVVNGFANFHHSYIYGPQLFLSGPEVSCAGSTAEYELGRPECVSAPVAWSVIGDASYEEVSPGIVQLNFNSQGSVTLVADVELFCGVISDTLHIEVTPPVALDLGPDTPICNDGTSVILDAGEGYESYLWQDESTEHTFEATAPGTYTVMVSNGICDFTDSIEITGFINSSIDLGPDLDLCNDIAILNAGAGFNDYTWQDGTQGPTYTVYEAGLYWVVAESPCFATDSVLVTDCGNLINSVGEEVRSLDAVFPNPASDFITVSLGSSADFVWMVDARGRRVFEQPVRGLDKVVVPIRDLSAGLYILMIERAGEIIPFKVQCSR